MIEFDLSLEILAEVIDKKTPFANALRDKFQSNPALRPHRGIVAGLAGCEIRHHILFEYLMKGIEGLEPKDKLAVGLTLANDYFYHRFPREEFDQELVKAIGEEKIALVQPLLDNSVNPEEYVPASVKRSSPLYLSLRYNVPDWALRIFRHYPHFPVLKTLKKFGRPATNSVRIRQMLSAKDLIATGDFEATQTEGILNYVGKVALRKNEDFRNGRLFPERELTKIILDAYRVSEPSEILLYNSNPESSLERELIESYGGSIGLNLATPDVDAKVEVSKMVRELGLHNVNFFSAPDPMAMDAAISRQQDLVIVAPESTNFDLTPTAPDYLLNFPREKMDELFAKEKAALEGASKFVEVDGKLIYIIYTISMKEGSQTITSFLQAHPEFSLVEEKQHFPYEPHATAAYVAVLIKKEKELPVAAALNELSTITPAASVSASASEQ